MNLALMKGVQLKYQPPHSVSRGGDRTVLGRDRTVLGGDVASAHSPELGLQVPAVPPSPMAVVSPPAWHRGGPDGRCHLAVPFPAPWDSGMGTRGPGGCHSQRYDSG